MTTHLSRPYQPISWCGAAATLAELNALPIYVTCEACLAAATEDLLRKFPQCPECGSKDCFSEPDRVVYVCRDCPNIWGPGLL